MSYELQLKSDTQSKQLDVVMLSCKVVNLMSDSNSCSHLSWKMFKITLPGSIEISSELARKDIVGHLPANNNYNNNIVAHIAYYFLRKHG